MDGSEENDFTPTRISEIVRNLDATVGFDKRKKSKLVRRAFDAIEANVQDGISFKTMAEELTRNGIEISAGYLNNIVNRIRNNRSKNPIREKRSEPAKSISTGSAAKTAATSSEDATGAAAVEKSSTRQTARQRRDELGKRYVPDVGTAADNPLLKQIIKE